jgi:ABC-type glycerol-3-phosphate transport system substrate-binding protein
VKKLTFILISIACGGCGFFEPSMAVLWTDRPEFALYAEYFNASQDRYKVEIRYVETPAQTLKDTKESPDIIVGSWLKNVSTRKLFTPLDGLFTKKLSKTAFYPGLLEAGLIEGRQYLLPIAFNIPTLVFTRLNSRLLTNPFSIGLEEFKTLGIAYNQEQNGAYTQMGFSPAWDPEFLYITVSLRNANFQEGDPLIWDPVALQQGIDYLREWMQANTGPPGEEDFVFRYFYEPPAVLTLSGRILFTYMNSPEFFTLPQERRQNLDFRWIAEQDKIPLAEETVYYGNYKKGKARRASAAFAQWFFTPETQKLLLETSKNQGIHETLFGISNGFSALRTVTEQIFPQFYPSLLGHIPPADFLVPSPGLPYNWPALKERVIIPYLQESIRPSEGETIRPLEKQIAEWYSLNKEF